MTRVSSNFDGADENPLLEVDVWNKNTGSWSNYSCKLIGNAVAGTSPNSGIGSTSMHKTPLSSADHNVIFVATFSATDGLNGCAPMVRSTAGSGNSSFYIAWFYWSTGPTCQVTLYRWNGTSLTAVGSTVTGITKLNGATVKLEVIGSTFKVYVNGVEKLSQTDSGHTGTYVGMAGYEGRERIDNFVGDDGKVIIMGGFSGGMQELLGGING